MIKESVELLGKGLYNGKIPDVLTIKSMPTATELEYVGGEDFDKVMLEDIIPKVVEEKFNPYDLYEVDYHYLNRCIRLFNYGPYFTTNAIFCDSCGRTSYGEYQVRLDSVDCVPIPDTFKATATIKKDEFIDFDGDVVLHLPTIKEMISAQKDTLFQRKNGTVNRDLARLCYMISSIKGNDKMTVIEKKLYIEDNFGAADYQLLKRIAANMMDFGLRAAGKTVCPKCGSKGAAFLALEDDRFFRPTLDDLRQWKHDRDTRGAEDVSGSTSKDV